MRQDDLLDELRRECPTFLALGEWIERNDGTPCPLDAVGLCDAERELATFITNRERAAAERMREQRDEARRAAIGYALVGCDEGVFEREECEDVNEWMREHGVLSLADVLEGLPASVEEPEEPTE